MADNDLGYFRDYPHIIFPVCIILYMILYTYLYHEYERDDDEY
jgi:Ca2+/Na+ antiporter